MNRFFIHLWYDDRYLCTLDFDISLIDLDLDSRSQECKKAKSSAPIISQSFPLIWMEFALPLRHDGVLNHILTLSHLFSIPGREPYLCDFVKKMFNVSFKFGLILKCTIVYILVSVLMTLTFIQGHSCMRNPKLWYPFSYKCKYQFGLNAVCCHSLLIFWSYC